MTKVCTKCEGEKELDDFPNCKKNKDGKQSWCKGCFNAHNRNNYHKDVEKERVRGMFYRASNYEKELERSRNYYRLNSEKVCKRTRAYDRNNRVKVNATKRKYRKNNPHCLEYERKYRKENAEKVNSYQREYYAKHPEKRRWVKSLKGNISQRISNGINSTLRYGGKGGHWENIVGYSYKQLVLRLKRTMPDGYAWDDFMSGALHIDHKIPVRAFNFEKPEDPDFQRCWALKNLQLLPAQANFIKSGKLEKPFQPSLIFGGSV